MTACSCAQTVSWAFTPRLRFCHVMDRADFAPALADLVYEVEDADKLDASTPISVKVTLERELDEDDDASTEIDTTVVAPLYPLKKQERVDLRKDDF